MRSKAAAELKWERDVTVVTKKNTALPLDIRAFGDETPSPSAKSIHLGG
jgi:hypothetical protein